MFNRLQDTVLTKSASSNSVQRLRELDERYRDEEEKLIETLDREQADLDRLHSILNLMRSDSRTALRVFSGFCTVRSAEVDERQRDLADLRSALSGVDEELEVAERRAAARLENRLRGALIAGLRSDRREPPMN